MSATPEGGSLRGVPCPDRGTQGLGVGGIDRVEASWESLNEVSLVLHAFAADGLLVHAPETVSALGMNVEAPVLRWQHAAFSINLSYRMESFSSVEGSRALGPSRRDRFILATHAKLCPLGKQAVTVGPESRVFLAQLVLMGMTQ